MLGDHGAKVLHIERKRTPLVPEDGTRQAPNVERKLTTIGIDPMVMTPVEFDEYVKTEIGMNAALVKTAGIKAN